jgi:hypothetical protein
MNARIGNVLWTCIGGKTCCGWLIFGSLNRKALCESQMYALKGGRIAPARRLSKSSVAGAGDDSQPSGETATAVTRPRFACFDDLSSASCALVADGRSMQS